MYQTHKSYTIEEALSKLQKYCAYQDRCHKEVEQKLKQMRMIPEAIEIIVVALIEDNHLNEERFAKAFVRGKFSIKKWGKRRLERELKQRHISDWNIKNAMKEISDKAYWESGQALAKKFWEAHRHRPLAEQKKKVWNAMQYRGWETELIMENILKLEHQKE